MQPQSIQPLLLWAEDLFSTFKKEITDVKNYVIFRWHYKYNGQEATRQSHKFHLGLNKVDLFTAVTINSRILWFWVI
jgi:hypothetical protein